MKGHRGSSDAKAAIMLALLVVLALLALAADHFGRRKQGWICAVSSVAPLSSASN
jgi:hypothetical protein